jgi:DNA-3-methyladenine glycosylase II
MVALLPRGELTPQALAALSDEQLRTAGISRQKGGYLRDLCAKVLAGDVPLDAVERMTDEEVIQSLVKIKGIGRWSAEMFLMFRLHRPDVLPVGDLGITNAVMKVYRMRKKPSAERLLRLGEAWRPYRSVASWYLWRSLGNAPGQLPPAAPENAERASSKKPSR